MIRLRLHSRPVVPNPSLDNVLAALDDLGAETNTFVVLEDTVGADVYLQAGLAERGLDNFVIELHDHTGRHFRFDNASRQQVKDIFRWYYLADESYRTAVGWKEEFTGPQSLLRPKWLIRIIIFIIVASLFLYMLLTRWL